MAVFTLEDPLLFSRFSEVLALLTNACLPECNIRFQPLSQSNFSFQNLEVVFGKHQQIRKVFFTVKQWGRNVELGQAEICGEKGNDFPKNDCGGSVASILVCLKDKQVSEVFFS